MAVGYEFGSGHFTLIPEISGLTKALSREMRKVTPAIQRGFGNEINESFGESLRGLSEQTKNVNIDFSGIASSLGKSFVVPAIGAISDVGRSMVTTLGNSAKTAAGIAGTAIAGLSGVAIAGGLERALSENNALSKLQALGYEASRIQEIMGTIDSVIDGKSYTKPEALSTATQLLASGVKEGKQLEEILKQTGKLADIGGSSFGEMGTIISRAFAGGIVYTEDINQLVERDIPIWAALSEAMGASVDDVKQSLSKGKVSFTDLQNAINTINFDSALFATQDAETAFKNFFTAIKKVGQSYWEPIIDNSAVLFNTLKGALVDLQKNPSYKAFLLTAQERITKLMGAAQKLAEKFQTAMQKLNVEKYVSKIEALYKPFEGLGPVIAGLVLALSSGFLSNIPIIGGMFSGITVPVGLLLGFIATLSLKFESFGNLMGTIGSKIEDFFTGLSDSFTTNGLFEQGSPIERMLTQVQNFINNFDFLAIGSKVGEGLNSIFSIFEGGLGGFDDNLRPLLESLEGLFQTLVETFTNVSGSFDGGNVAENITTLITGMVDGLNGLIPILGNVVSKIAEFVTSDTFSTVFNGLVEVASFIMSNSAVLIGFIALLATVFVAAKIMRFINGITILVNGLTKTLGNVIGFQTMFNTVRVILRGLSSLVGPILQAMPAILLIAGLIVGVTGLLLLLREMGLFEMIGELLDYMLEKAQTILTTIVDVFGEILKHVGDFLEKLADSLETLIPVISDSIVDLVNAFGDNFVKIINSLESFLVMLADKGPESLVGATAFALGLAEISLAMGTLAGSNALGGLSKMLSGDEDSPLETLTDLVTALSSFSTEINKLPDTLMIVLPSAFSSGFKIGEEIQNGLFDGFNFSNVKNEFNNLIDSLQAEADSNPIVIKIDDAQLRSYRAEVRNERASSGVSRTSNTNNNNVFNVTTKNSDFVKDFIKSSRGYI